MSAAHEMRVAAALATFAELDSPGYPDQLADQIRAATADAHGFVHRFAALAAVIEPNRWAQVAPRSNDDDNATKEAWLRIMLAVEGGKVCQHLRTGGPQPATARLALHRVDCQRCLATVRRPPADEADRCDWCGERDIETFLPIVVHVGPLVAIGDACTTCGTALRTAAGVTS